MVNLACICFYVEAATATLTILSVSNSSIGTNLEAGTSTADASWVSASTWELSSSRSCQILISWKWCMRSWTTSRFLIILESRASYSSLTYLTTSCESLNACRHWAPNCLAVLRPKIRASYSTLLFEVGELSLKVSLTTKSSGVKRTMPTPAPRSLDAPSMYILHKILGSVVPL